MEYRPDLQCDVASLAYDFETQTGTLRMAPDNNCDMTACTTLFERIDAGVRRINTIAGSIPDTYYKKTAGEWRAFVRAT